MIVKELQTENKLLQGYLTNIVALNLTFTILGENGEKVQNMFLMPSIYTHM